MQDGEVLRSSPACSGELLLRCMKKEEASIRFAPGHKGNGGGV